MPRRRDGLERRDALLDAALRCFSRSGVLAVGIEEIRREAAASPSSVYNLFSSLNDLTLALLTRTFERLFSHLVARVDQTRSARNLVETLVDAHLEWILGHPDQGRFMYQGTALEFTASASETLQRRKADLLAPIVAHMAPFVRAGLLPSWSVLQFDVVVLGASHEACRRFLAGAPLDPDWMRKELPRLAWWSVAAERRAARRGG
jgi:AcrR family transcriptional regulator